MFLWIYKFSPLSVNILCSKTCGASRDFVKDSVSGARKHQQLIHCFSTPRKILKSPDTNLGFLNASPNLSPSLTFLENGD